jgi:FAD/FMN-containing dehydrogenase
LKEEGCFFPADPTETLCSIGGIVANNSSGASSFKYGAARNFVEGLLVVLPDGEGIKIKRGNLFEKNGYYSFKTLSLKVYNLPAPKINLPATKNASGYYSKKGADLIDLFVGSEGTLGVFSKIKLRVLPLPEKVFSCVAFFKDVEEALGFVEEAREATGSQSNRVAQTTEITETTEDLSTNNEIGSLKTTEDTENTEELSTNNEIGSLKTTEDTENTEELSANNAEMHQTSNLIPHTSYLIPNTSLRSLEFFDGKSLEFLREDFVKVPEGMGAAVWFEVETTEADLEIVVSEWADRITKYNSSLDDSWYAYDENDQEEIRKFRHAVSYKVNEFIAKQGLMKLGTDTAVPKEHFKEFYYFAVSLPEKAGLQSVAYGHFGDCHLHLNMLPKNEEEYEKGKEIYLEICKRAVELGGTVSAEHGIGKLKKEYLKLMFGEEGIKEMKKVKKYLDPKNILNVGNLF